MSEHSGGDAVEMGLKAIIVFLAGVLLLSIVDALEEMIEKRNKRKLDERKK